MINKNKFRKECSTCIYFYKENSKCLLFKIGSINNYCCGYYKNNYSLKEKITFNYLFFCVFNFLKYLIFYILNFFIKIFKKVKKWIDAIRKF